MWRILVVFLIFPLVGNSQTISISGKAQGRVFDKIQVRIYADQFSHLKKTIAETTTDEDGNFSLSLDYPKTNYAFLSVELLEGEFYLVPNSGFTFNVFPDTAHKGSVYDQLPLQFDINADDGGLNDSLASFNVLYNNFVMNHFNDIYRSRDLSIINQLRKSVEDKFGGYNNSYFNTYVKYALAQLEWVSKKKSTKAIVAEYFARKPIFYNNIQYTDFFKEIFKEYFVSSFYASDFDSLVNAVYQGSFKRMDNILSRDTLLGADRELRELVLMQALSRFYHNPDFSDKGIIQILEQMKSSSKIPLHREIAGNFIAKLTHLERGTPAPDFNLPVSSGKSYSPNDFKGAVTIFDFMKSDCKVCLSHLDFLKDMASRMGNKIRIVILAYGDHPEKIAFLLKQRDLDWTVLYVGKRIDVLQAYGVKIFPTYIILNPDATIGLAPASMADENLENEVKRALNDAKKVK